MVWEEEITIQFTQNKNDWSEGQLNLIIDGGVDKTKFLKILSDTQISWNSNKQNVKI